MGKTVIKDGYGKTQYANVTGAGTSAKPFVPTAHVYGDLLALGAKSLELTLDGSGLGSFPIDDTWGSVGIYPKTTACRFGIETTEADGSATGAAIASAFKKGVPVLDVAQWSLFTVDRNVSGKVGYIRGTAGAKFIIYGVPVDQLPSQLILEGESDLLELDPSGLLILE